MGLVASPALGTAPPPEAPGSAGVPDLSESVINLERADRVEYLEKDRLLILSGDVRVEFEGNTIRAESIRIDLEKNVITAEGNLTWDGDDLHASGSRMTFNTKTEEGMVEDVTLRIGEWICRGDRVVQPEKNVAKVEPGTITTCDLEDPHYTIRCKRLRIRLGRDLAATQVTVLVGRTPVFWLPALVTPIREFRLPFEAQVGQTGELGAFVRTSPSYRFGSRLPGQLHVDYFQRKGWGYGLTQEVLDAKGARMARAHGYWIRERTPSYGNVPEERWQVFAESSRAVGPTTRISGRVAQVSDAYFRELYGIDNLDLPTTAGQRTANFVLSQRLPGANATVLLNRVSTQTLNPASLQAQSAVPAAANYTLSSVHAPRVSVATSPIPLAPWLNASLQTDGDRMYSWQNGWYVNSLGLTPTLEAYGRFPVLGSVSVRPGVESVWRDRGDRVLRTNAVTGATEFLEDNKRGGVYKARAHSSLRPPAPPWLSMVFSHNITQRLNKRIDLDPLDRIYRGLEAHAVDGRLSSSIGPAVHIAVSSGYDLRNRQDPVRRRWYPLVPEITITPVPAVSFGASAKYDLWDRVWRRYLREAAGDITLRRPGTLLSASVQPRYVNNRTDMLSRAATSAQSYRLSQHVYGASFQDASAYRYFFLIDGTITVPITPRILSRATGQFDAYRHRFSFYTASLTRDLHCWEMTGTFQQFASGEYQFRISMGLKAFPHEALPLFRL